MWNPSRRSADKEPFPEPKWRPIQDLDRIDIIAKWREGGGVDLAIVASQPIDDSPRTLESIRHKVATYLETIGCKDFQAEGGLPAPRPDEHRDCLQ